MGFNLAEYYSQTRGDTGRNGRTGTGGGGFSLTAYARSQGIPVHGDEPQMDKRELVASVLPTADNRGTPWRQTQNEERSERVDKYTRQLMTPSVDEMLDMAAGKWKNDTYRPASVRDRAAPFFGDAAKQQEQTEQTQVPSLEQLESELAHAQEMYDTYSNLYGSGTTTPAEKQEALVQKNRFAEEIARIQGEMEQYGIKTTTGNWLTGALKQSGASVMNVAPTIVQGISDTSEKSRELANALRGDDDGSRSLDYGSTGDPELDAYLAQISGNAQQANARNTGKGELAEYGVDAMEWVQRTQAQADQLEAQAQEEIAASKAGKGKVAQTLIDIGVAGVQMAADIGTAMVTGGSTLLPMAVRTFGSGAMEARQAGGNTVQQFAYGLASAAVETLTEKLFSGNALMKKAFGPGFADGIAEGLIGKMKTATGKMVFKGVTSVLEEGAEEFISGVLNPVISQIYNDQALAEGYGSGAATAQTIVNSLYDALVGGVLGLAGYGVSARSTYRGYKAQAAENVPSATDAKNAPVSGTSPATTTGTSVTVNAGADAPGAPGLINSAEPAAPQSSGASVGATGIESSMPGTGTDGLGAANRGFTTTPGQQVQTQNKTVTQSKYMTEEEKARLAPGTHEQVTAEMSAERAGQSFYTDSEGNIVNLDVTVEELLNKEAWTASGQDAAQTAQKMLIEQARKDGDWSKVTELANAIERQGTIAGQSLQARQKWISDSPEDIVSTAANILKDVPDETRDKVLKTVSKLAADYGNARGKAETSGLVDIIRRTAQMRGTTGLVAKNLSKTMNWALNLCVKNGDTDFLRRLAANGIVSLAQDAANPKPSFADAFKTLRRNAMLSKAATILRNLVGNGAFDITDTVSRDISVPLDILLSKYTGTRSVAVDKGYFNKAKAKGNLDGLAKSMLEVGLDVDASGESGKYEYTSNRTFKMSGGKVGRLLSTWEKYMGYAMTTTDATAKGGTQAEIQRGIDELRSRGLIKDNSLDNAGQMEALYRTFQDDTKLSKLSSGFRDVANILQIRGVGLGDIALPFAKTPANLASRAIEYSPVGLAKGAYDLAKVLYKAHSGTLTAAEQAKAVQEIGRGLNGTALIGIATAMTLSGIIRTLGSGKDDEDANALALAKTAGQYGTQLNLSALFRGLFGQSTEWKDGDKLMSISFLEPLNAQLTIGAMLADDYLEGNLDLMKFFQRSVDGAFSAVMDMPVMSVFADTAEAYRYSQEDNEGGKLRNAVAQFAASQMSSLVPNAIKGIAQGTDKYQRDQYSSNTLAGQTWDSIKAGIPGLRQTLPIKQDSYGRDMETEGGVMGFLNANINPGAINTYKPDKALTMTDMIYEQLGLTGIYPERKAPYSFSQDNEKYILSTEEKRQYMQTAGGALEEFHEATVDNELFDMLPIGVQGAVLAAERTEASSIAKAQIVEERGGTDNRSDSEIARQALEAGDLVTYIVYSQAAAAAEKANATQEILDIMDQLMAKRNEINPDVLELLETMDGFKRYEAAIAGGVSSADYYATDNIVKALEPAAGYTSTAGWQKIEAINGTDLSDKDKLTLIKAYCSSEKTAEKFQTAFDRGYSLDVIVAYYIASTNRNAEGKSPTVYEVGQRMRDAGYGVYYSQLKAIFE